MPTVLTREAEYPRVEDNASAPRVTDCLWGTSCTYADFFAALPALGTTSAWGTTASNCFLVDRNIKRGIAGDMWRAELVYRPRDARSGVREEAETEYTLEDGGLDTPIENHPSYRTIWNYHLSGAPGVTAAFTGYLNATDTTPASQSLYRWIKEPTELKEADGGGTWTILVNKSKPGVDSYIRPAPAVVMRKFYAGKTSADTAVESYTVGEIKAPGNAFGITGGSWLIMDVGVVPDGRYWVATVRYQHDSKGWDTDIYA